MHALPWFEPRCAMDIAEEDIARTLEMILVCHHGDDLGDKDITLFTSLRSVPGYVDIDLGEGALIQSSIMKRIGASEHNTEHIDLLGTNALNDSTGCDIDIFPLEAWIQDRKPMPGRVTIRFRVQLDSADIKKGFEQYVRECGRATNGDIKTFNWLNTADKALEWIREKAAGR